MPIAWIPAQASLGKGGMQNRQGYVRPAGKRLPEHVSAAGAPIRRRGRSEKELAFGKAVHW
jgi:hypothetical protein